MAGGGAWEHVNGTYFATKSLQKLNVTTCSRILSRKKAILEALCFRSVRPSVNVRACVPGRGIFRPDSRRLLVIFFISNINNHIYTALYFVTSEALNFDFGNPMYTFERFGHVVVQMTSR